MRNRKSDALSDRITEKIAFEKRLDEVKKECCKNCIHKKLIGDWCKWHGNYNPECKEFEAR